MKVWIFLLRNFKSCHELDSIIISIPNRLIDHLMTSCSLLINLVIIRLTPQATINGMKVKRKRDRQTEMKKEEK